MSENTPPQRRRRRRIWIFLGICLVVVLLIWSRDRPKLDPGTVLTVRLEGEIAEHDGSDPFHKLGQLLNKGDGPVSLHELRRALGKAQSDPRISGVLLEIHPSQLGFGAVEEVRDLVASVGKAGKPVTALLAGDVTEEKEYLLAAAADRIVTTPESGLLLNGLLAEVTFYRGLLDKIGIEPQMIQFKDYKSAGEPLVNKKMSPAMKEATTSLLTGIHGHFLAYVSERRKLSADAVRALIDRGLMTAQEGQKERLLDGIAYRDEALSALPGQLKKNSGERRTVSVGQYLKHLGDDPQIGNVALIYATGPIVAGSSSGMGSDIIEGEKLARVIRQAGDDAQIKALVLRVDSPGGSAVGSDFVWREVQRLKGKKPVVVSMSTVAGSGGYWISMNADRIVAQPSTITGSIGVIALHFNISPLYQWAGITVDPVKIGAQADLFSPLHPWDEGKERLIRTWMGHTYEDFKDKVAKGRGLTKDQVETIAQGRVWTGTQGKGIKLVDELGGVRQAIVIAQKLAQVKEDELAEPVLYPKDQGLWAAFSQGMDAHVAAQAATQESLQDKVGRVIRALSLSRPSLTMPVYEIR